MARPNEPMLEELRVILIEMEMSMIVTGKVIELKKVSNGRT